ncbi:hypothetical protein P7K49_026118 [Saguinus oedipus]|uniref:Uncharacterized protein n=1 Tax=Saguinus oedipus TaxID=9490 RepID=A0ABQ9UJ25_SAGOE|nr:hypothetical protein P7K49_026118 [Saguinus oedipus]
MKLNVLLPSWRPSNPSPSRSQQNGGTGRCQAGEGQGRCVPWGASGVTEQLDLARARSLPLALSATAFAVQGWILSTEGFSALQEQGWASTDSVLGICGSSPSPYSGRWWPPLSCRVKPESHCQSLRAFANLDHCASFPGASPVASPAVLRQFPCAHVRTEV